MHASSVPMNVAQRTHMGLMHRVPDWVNPPKDATLQKNECDEIQAQGGNECDLTLYVVWTGTDVNGSYLTSSSNRFSAFNPKQVKDQMRDGIKDLVPDIDWPWL
mmetsp:Transcript_23239/g.33998  ORF Transcript_23239/g.33998 Transcript_23239/m.33998 type:complete len:104 (+) Transcript_23239:444-755(+)